MEWKFPMQLNLICVPFRELVRAYHWKDETLTRLEIAKTDDTLIILHQPMMPCYTDPVEYRQIISPILKDEWKGISTTMKIEHETTGRLVDFVVETIGEDKRVRDVIAVEIRNISKTKHWNIENQANIKHATIEMIISKSEKVFNTIS
jgi:hypothetical protein